MDFCSFDPNTEWKTVNYYCLFNNIAGSWVSGKWYVNYLKKHATLIWSNLNEYGGIDTNNGVISVTPSEEITLSSSYFDPDNITLYNTELTPDAYGFNDIGLSFPDRLVSIVFDESGSMTWRDSGKLRHTIAHRYVENLLNTYPGNVKYKIFKFGGKTIHINFSSDLTSNNPYATSQNFFQQYLFKDPINKFNGIRIVRRDDAYPANPVDGEIIFDGISSNFHDTGLQADKTYYYSIYTFDDNYKFSNGVKLIAKPTDSILPRGVKTVQTEVLSGSGVIVDDNVRSVWHMDEGTGDTLYDFNANVDLSVSDSNPIWMNKRDVPVGSSGIRFNGTTTSVSTLSSTSRLSLSSNDKITIMAWVYPFSLTNQSVIISRASSNGIDLNYILGIDGANNRLSFQKGTGVGDLVYSNVGALEENEWNHVSCVVDLMTLGVSFYVNGVPFGSSVLVDGITDSSDMILSIGSSTLPVYNNFFGYMTEISIHGVARDFDYITRQNSILRNDNGDRLLVFKYTIPSIYGFLDTNVHIIKNNFNIPSNIYDGDPIYSQIISSEGEYYTTYRENFLLGSTYYFRIFSEDVDGNVTSIDDAMSLLVDITNISDEDREDVESDISLPVPQNVAIYEGDRKVHLQWTLSVDDRISRVRIYRSTLAVPVVGNSGQSDSELVFEGDPIENISYTDRSLPNNIRYYYALVSVDRYERISVAANISAKPQEGLDESNIPLMDVKNITYTIDSGTSLNVMWDDVVQVKDLSTYLPQNISFYMQLTDDNGNVLQENYDISAEVSGSYSYPENVAEDVFLDTSEEGVINSPTLESLYSISITNIQDGVAKGEIIPSSSIDLFGNIQKMELTVRFTISMSVSGTDILSYKSLPLYMEWLNPLSFDVDNRDNRYVTVTSKKRISALDNQIPSTDIKYDGPYVGASKPYVARVYFFDQGLLSTSYSSVEVQVWDADMDWSDADAVPTRVQQSSIVANLEELKVQIGTRNILDDYGNDTGEVEPVSYVDVRLSKPEQSMGVFLYVKVVLPSGYYIIKRVFVVFGNPLKIELIPRVPISDGREVAEQVAVVYKIDPDNPEDRLLRTYPNDSTLVSWTLEGGDYAIERIFYSTDTVSRTDGIYSTIHSGVAKQIMFGPLNNVSIQAYDTDGNPRYETHKLIASVFYDGITATDSIDLELIPLRERGHRVMPSDFLMEFVDLKQPLWSDGIGYAALVISHDATTSTTKYSQAFRDCLSSRGKNIYQLSHGQMIRIDTEDPEVEIIWGDVTEYLDPYLDRWELDTTNATIAYGEASINLSQFDETYVYFRLNRTYSDQKPIGFESLKTECSMFGANKETKYKHEIVVTGHIVSEFDGQIITLAGGGSMETGILPTILVPREPLDIEIADRRVKDQSGNISQSSGVIIDGKSINQLILDISFAEGNVPDGTTVSVSVINYGEESVKVVDSVLSVVNSIDTIIDPTREHSYVTLEIQALQPRKDLTANIYLSVTYDELKKVTRTKTICLLVRNDATDWLDESAISGMRSIFGSRTDSYDISTHKWNLLSDMSEARGHLGVEVVSNIMYAMGGINSTNISNTVEAYDISSNTWTTKSPMSGQRMSFASVVVGDNIYVFGGVEYSINENKLSVTRKSEVYNTISDTWTDIEDMPLIDIGAINNVSYGVAYGKAIYVSALNRIYIVSGIKDITGNGAIVDYNDRVLYYDVALDTWVYSDVIVFEDFIQYFRISPIAFLDGDNIISLSGSYQNTDYSLDYLSTAYSYNTITGNIVRADGDFDHMLQPRYLTGSCVNGDKIYVIGGSGEKSETLSNFEEIHVMGGDPKYQVSELAPALKSRNGCGSVVVNNNGQDVMLVTGGIESGKGSGFLNIKINAKEDILQLNGSQNFDAIINAIDDSGHTNIDADIKVNAYLQKMNAVDDSLIPVDYLSQNVLLYEDELGMFDGKTIASLLPRSDDMLTNIVSQFTQTGTSISDRYKIVLQATVTGGFVDNTISTSGTGTPYYGQTPIGIIKTGETATDISSACFISLISNTTIESLYNSIYGDNSFKVLSSPLYQDPSYAITCGSKIMSIPAISDLTSEGEVTANEAVSIIDSLDNTDPNGSSPLYDTLGDLAISLSEEQYDSLKKNVILFTDHDQNTSEATLSDAIGSMNYIEGPNNVPVLSGDLSVYDKRNLLAYSVNRTGDFYLDKLSYYTGGQSFSIISDKESFIKETLCSLTGKLKGSPGYGSAEYTLDLGDTVTLTNVSVSFDIPDNATGQWKLSVSENGYEYTPYTIYTNYDSSMQFSGLLARYIKLFVKITSCFEPSEEPPKVIGFSLSYIPTKYDYLYTNDIDTAEDIQQAIVSIDANSENGKIEVGISRSSSHNWDDYNKDGSPSKRNSGKIVLPMRGDYEIVPAVLEDPLSGSVLDFGDIEI